MKNVFESIKDINEKLADRISKEIYANKLMYCITGDAVYMRNIWGILDKELDLLPNFNIHKNQPAVIFGCGNNGRFIKRCFPEIDWKCYVDNNAFPGMIVEAIPVISVDELRRTYPDAYIVVSPRFEYKNIMQQLKDNSFVEKNIYLYGAKEELLASKIYFDLPYLSHCHNEVFVDAGVLDGETSLAFARWSGGEYSHIHMFEPNIDVHTEIRKNVMSIGDKYTLHKEGLWNRVDMLDFWADEQHLSGAKIIENSQKCNQKVNVIDLDTALQGERVTFLKMDIEGAEKQALEGAENIIRRYHPKLAISVYHKQSDLWEIPRVILDIDPEYKFYIRHYCLNAADTVLYAV